VRAVLWKCMVIVHTYTLDLKCSFRLITLHVGKWKKKSNWKLSWMKNVELHVHYVEGLFVLLQIRIHQQIKVLLRMNFDLWTFYQPWRNTGLYSQYILQLEFWQHLAGVAQSLSLEHSDLSIPLPLHRLNRTKGHLPGRRRVQTGWPPSSGQQIRVRRPRLLQSEVVVQGMSYLALHLTFSFGGQSGSSKNRNVIVWSMPVNIVSNLLEPFLMNGLALHDYTENTRYGNI
jgi:hypothetical protein